MPSFVNVPLNAMKGSPFLPCNRVDLILGFSLSSISMFNNNKPSNTSDPFFAHAWDLIVSQATQSLGGSSMVGPLSIPQCSQIGNNRSPQDYGSKHWGRISDGVVGTLPTGKIRKRTAESISPLRSYKEKIPGEAKDVQFDSANDIEKDGLVKLSKSSNGPWLENNQDLKPCWSSANFDEIRESRGYVAFSLTNGPEYHVSQIADAIVVAKYLSAKLVLPHIRGSKPGDKRNFEDVYDVEKFIKSLDGVVKVEKELPYEISIRDLAAVKVPNRVTEDHIAESIEPTFKSKGSIRLVTYFPTVNMRKTAQKSSVDSVECLGMFGTLELQTEVNEVVDAMIERLKTLSRKSDHHFIAVDLRVDILENKNCRGSGSTTAKSCYNAQEIALFLRKVGFGTDTTIYVTQSRWDDSLGVLKDIFPKTYTKESIMPEEKKRKFLESENSELEKVIDFHICSRSDVFVPAISGLFYANVAGKRIALGKPQILVPAEIPGTSAMVTDYLSPYVAKKNHLAYSCFC